MQAGPPSSHGLYCCLRVVGGLRASCATEPMTGNSAHPHALGSAGRPAQPSTSCSARSVCVTQSPLPRGVSLHRTAVRVNSVVLVSTSTNSMQNVQLCMQGEGKCQPELQVALWRRLHLPIDLGRNQSPIVAALMPEV